MGVICTIITIAILTGEALYLIGHYHIVNNFLDSVGKTHLMNCFLLAFICLFYIIICVYYGMSKIIRG